MDVGRILPLPGRSIWKCKDKAGCGLRVRRIQSTPGLCLVIVKAKAAGIRSRTDRGKERKVWAEGEDARYSTRKPTSVSTGLNVQEARRNESQRDVRDSQQGGELKEGVDRGRGKTHDRETDIHRRDRLLRITHCAKGELLKERVNAYPWQQKIAVWHQAKSWLGVKKLDRPPKTNIDA
ncbi:hypothetical protein K438DRAFT_1768084 [Mycena galopus ATCC 62051]|nr:hypothetical protein K438DRAFT_1768084 [Mycena galopus ATCC 62051]